MNDLHQELSLVIQIPRKRRWQQPRRPFYQQQASIQRVHHRVLRRHELHDRDHRDLPRQFHDREVLTK